MINLEKISQSASRTTPFKKTCPCTILPLHFLIFQIPPPSKGGNQNSPPPLKRIGGGGGGGSQLCVINYEE